VIRLSKLSVGSRQNGERWGVCVWVDTGEQGQSELAVWVPPTKAYEFAASVVREADDCEKKNEGVGEP